MSIEIAAAVLAEARELDRRIEPTPGTIKAWANCFGLHRVWRAEALEAVHRHYGRANAYPLMPGDVIAHCERQHPWSSRDHAGTWLDTMARYPYSPVFEDYTGIRQPDPPAGASLDDERDLHRKWIAENRETLIDGIMTRRHRPPECER